MLYVGVGTNSRATATRTIKMNSLKVTVLLRQTNLVQTLSQQIPNFSSTVGIGNTSGQQQKW